MRLQDSDVRGNVLRGRANAFDAFPTGRMCIIEAYREDLTVKIGDVSTSKTTVST